MEIKAKDYMQQIRKLDRLISNKLIEIAQWRDVAESTTGGASDSERVQSSGNQQRMEASIVKYLDLEAEVKTDDMERYIKQKNEIIQTIEQLNASEYDVLHKIYIQGMEFQDVAEMAGKSYSWATTVHGRALASLQRILDKKC